MKPRSIIMAAAISLFLSVCFGAFGAHALKNQLSADYLVVWNTATHYQMIHSLGLLAIAACLNYIDLTWATRAAKCLISGIILFSGSLYVLSLTQITWIGAITPIGGLAFLVGWLCLLVAAMKKNSPRS